jgi:hypothetical protein
MPERLNRGRTLDGYGAWSFSFHTLIVRQSDEIMCKGCNKKTREAHVDRKQHPLRGEMTCLAFEQSGVRQDDWNSCPILNMADNPEIEVVLINNPSTGVYGAGSEAANALAVQGIVAALHDATGKQMRRIPLKAGYVKELMKG